MEYVRSGKDWKQSPPSHPVRTLGSVVEEVGVEDTAKGQVVVVSGTRVLVRRQERQRLLEVLHETHLGVGTMLAIARHLWWWPGMSNNVRQVYSNFQACMLGSRAKSKFEPCH